MSRHVAPPSVVATSLCGDAATPAPASNLCSATICAAAPQAIAAMDTSDIAAIR